MRSIQCLMVLCNPQEGFDGSDVRCRVRFVDDSHDGRSWMRLIVLAGIVATAVTFACSSGATAAPLNATVIDNLATKLNVAEPAYCRTRWVRRCWGGYCRTRWWRRCW